MIKLSICILLMFVATISLIHTTLSTIDFFAASVLFSQLFTMLGCFVIVGIGAGLPIVILASVLGWVQLVLLVSGNIDPHLAKESFFGVLKTLLKEF